MEIYRETKLDISKDDFVLVSTLGNSITVRNLDENPILVVYTNINEKPTGDVKGPILGGRITELTTDPSKFSWAKSLGESDGVLYSRDPSQTQNLPEEFFELNSQVEKLLKDFIAHTKRKDNPHDVTREQTDVDTPNEWSSDIKSNEEDVLATTHLTFQIYSLLEKHFKEINPHHLKKNHVGLSHVENFSFIEDKDIHTRGITDKYVSPEQVQKILDKRISEVTINALVPVLPQCVLEGKIGDYAVDLNSLPDRDINLEWEKFGISRKSKFLEQVNKNTVRVKKGLKCSFVYDTEICVSHPLALDLDVEINLSGKEGLYYLFAVMNEKNYITDIEVCKNPLRESLYPIYDDYDGYTFNTCKMSLFNKQGAMQKRCEIGTVYISKVLLGASEVNSIVEVIPCVLGNRYTFALGIEPFTKTLNSVFQTRNVKCDISVFYKGKLSKPYWDSNVGAVVQHNFNFVKNGYEDIIRVGANGMLQAGGPDTMHIEATESPVARKLTAIVSLEKFT